MPENESTSSSLPTLAMLGATGDLGGGLARRWAAAGYTIVIGSRSREKGAGSAADVNEQLRGLGMPETVRGTDNLTAARQGDVVVLTVPYAFQRATLEGVGEALQGKILIDCTVPLVPPKVARVQLPDEGCAAVIAQEVLGPGVRVVSAFQNVGAAHLREEDAVDCDVLVTGDDPSARAEVIELIEALGMRGWHAGPLDNAAAAEALTSVLIQLNRKYGIAGAGIRITGEPTRAP
ncbi:MAG: NADPH-dependent F420 reductase [Holophagales bacterium]|nr:NADPH-dependent F420 reductase [Holophagales bacterium]MYH25776.1 NADPH-dependent F420 reductase [Holophagales bacterium]